MTITSSRYLIRAMTIADIPRVSEIERESFPTMAPQSVYKRELQRNNLAAYLVVSETPYGAPPASSTSGAPSVEQSDTARVGNDTPSETESGRGLRRLLRRIGDALSDRTSVGALEGGERILGFVGLWFMVDEAHIVTLAVAEAERRRGLGELLLIAAIELAERRDQAVLTLECRVSNTAAQALYEKYGFRRVGVRKRYYTDNDEDALIMTTFPIHGEEFAAEFQRLRAAYTARRGAPRVAHPELRG